MRITKRIQSLMRCPVSHVELVEGNGSLFAKNNSEISYPIIDEVPVLINESNSLFSHHEFSNRVDTTVTLQRSEWAKMIAACVPSISENVVAGENYRLLAELLPKNATVLVVGGSYRGQGIEKLFSREDIEIVGSDVSFGPECDMIIDAHDIPFIDDSFDCVIAQAVLEHVVQPHRCVEEMTRVLKTGGYIYSETPFMQQVHMKQYDFTRFTHLGHNLLFAQFDLIKSGPVGGTGSALAWAWVYFLRSMVSSKRLSKLVTVAGRFTSFPLKYVDRLIKNVSGTYDGASAFYFLGKKRQDRLNPKDIILGFKGL